MTRFGRSPWFGPIGQAALAGLIGHSGAVAQEAPQTGDRLAQAIPGTSVTFEMAYVAGGAYRLGSQETETGRDDDEGPERRVRLSPFWIGVHEVTDEEFSLFRHRDRDSEATAISGRRLDVDAVSRPSPPYEDPAHGLDKGRHPATGMTQWAALQYARWLSEKTGRLYRLPTETEWEVACRAGTAGPTPETRDAIALDEIAWHVDNSAETHHAVGEKASNAWSVHDMLGNVAEWTLDEYRSDFYSSLEDGALDPWARPQRSRPRTVRGGAFDDAPEALRCADRLESTLRWKRRDPQIPKSRWWNTDSPHVGFRLVSPAGDLSLEEIRAAWGQLLDESPGG